MLCQELESFRGLKDYLEKEGGGLHIIKIPSNSPQLNLVEQYNRELRAAINKWMAMPTVQELVHGERAPKNQVVQHRIAALKALLVLLPEGNSDKKV